MAAPDRPGSNRPDDRPEANLESSLGNLLPQPVYQVLRNHFLRPHDTVHVSRYFFREWFPRLGLQRWLLVLILRESLDSASQPGMVRITREELAGLLECSEKTVTDLLRHTAHPTRKGWRAIDPTGPDGQVDLRRTALSLFIPRLRYWYEKNPDSDGPPKRRGFIIAVSRDDPLTAEDEARMRALNLEQISNIVAGDVAAVHRENQGVGQVPERSAAPSGARPERALNLLGDSLKGKANPSQSLKGPDDPILLTLTKLTKYIQEDINRTLTTMPEIRRALAPLVRAAEDTLADFHSTGMFYKVLCALYPDHLGLFVQAVGEALEVGKWDAGANLGAIFVESIKMLAQETGIDLGFGNVAGGPDRVELAEERLLGGKLTGDGEPATGIDGWTADGLWQQALASLQLQMPKATFDTWLYRTHGIGWDGSRLVVELRNTQAREWLENRMHSKIVRSVRDLVGHDVQVQYECRAVT